MLKPKRSDLESIIHDKHLRADQLAREGKHARAEVERKSAAKYEKQLPNSR